MANLHAIARHGLPIEFRAHGDGAAPLRAISILITVIRSSCASEPATVADAMRRQTPATRNARFFLLPHHRPLLLVGEALTVRPAVRSLRNQAIIAARYQQRCSIAPWHPDEAGNASPFRCPTVPGDRVNARECGETSAAGVLGTSQFR